MCTGLGNAVESDGIACVPRDMLVLSRNETLNGRPAEMSMLAAFNKVPLGKAVWELTKVIIQPYSRCNIN